MPTTIKRMRYLMPSWLSWLIAFVRGVLGIRAEIQQKREVHIGEVIQQNADLRAQNAANEAAFKADVNAPRSKAHKLAVLLRGEE
jgi:hypothetical protein